MININTSPDKLKKSILQEAMQGKLTQQLSTDGNVADLLQSIDEEKRKLIKEGKIKKPKQLTTIADDKTPFKIPDNWQWVRLNDVGVWQSGSTPRRNHPEYYGGKIPWLKTGDLNDDYINDTTEKITQSGINHSSLNINPVGSILIAMYGATISKLGILDIQAATNQACCACNLYNGVYNRFLFYYLMSQRSNLIGLGAGGAQPNISRTKIVHYAFPLPPLDEQKRIVTKLDALLPKVDSFKQSVHYIQELRSELPPRLRRSFLQEAMQGQLTQQLPEDGDAADLLQSIAEEKQRLYKAGKIKKPKQLAAITDDEIPFKIPDNWQWCKLGNLALYDIGGNTPSKANQNNWNKNGIPWLSVKDINNGYVHDSIDHISIEASKSTARMIPSNSFIAVTRMAVGKFTINTKPMAINQDLRALIMDDNIINYIQLIYPILQFKTKGATVKGITKKELLNTIIPLPPLKEQKRIIDKLKSLLAKIDKI